MPDYVELVKRAALEAVDASGPVHIEVGKVISTSPLKIQIDQKSTLTEKMLILTRNVTDYEVDVSIGNRNRSKMTVHNALAVNEEVLLLRMQGGKKFVVLDRTKLIPGLKGE